MLELIYSIYKNIESECPIMDTVYDLSHYCSDHDCSHDHLLENFGKHADRLLMWLDDLKFYYDDYNTRSWPSEDEHLEWFDFYTMNGQFLGKLTRWTLAFNPKEINKMYHHT